MRLTRSLATIAILVLAVPACSGERPRHPDDDAADRAEGITRSQGVYRGASVFIVDVGPGVAGRMALRGDLVADLVADQEYEVRYRLTADTQDDLPVSQLLGYRDVVGLVGSPVATRDGDATLGFTTAHGHRWSLRSAGPLVATARDDEPPYDPTAITFQVRVLVHPDDERTGVLASHRMVPRYRCGITISPNEIRLDLVAIQAGATALAASEIAYPVPDGLPISSGTCRLRSTAYECALFSPAGARYATMRFDVPDAPAGQPFALDLVVADADRTTVPFTCVALDPTALSAASAD